MRTPSTFSSLSSSLSVWVTEFPRRSPAEGRTEHPMGRRTGEGGNWLGEGALGGVWLERRHIVADGNHTAVEI